MPSLQGDTLQIDGWIQTALYTDYQAKRQQLLGLVDNEDEDVVPLTMTQDSTHDGFYRPVSVQVDSPVGTNNNTAARFSIRLQRLRDYASPLFETSVQSALRVNAFGITAPTHIVQVLFSAGAGAVYLPWVTPVPSSLVGAGTSDGGGFGIDRRVVSSLLSTPLQFQFGHRASTYYIGSCRVEGLYGATWFPLVGRPTTPLVQGQWRISNGQVRLTLGASFASPAVLEVWDSTLLAWEAVNLLHNDSAASALGYAGLNVTGQRLEILRNSPEMVVVRVSGFVLQETFTIRRGGYQVAWTVKNAGGNSISTTTGVKFATATACTAITAGIRPTANDANGNQTVLASAHACTTDLVNGAIRLTASQTTPATFMLGISLNGSTASTGNTPAELVGQFMGVTSWRQRVIAP
jgi:hypothetical protein